MKWNFLSVRYTRYICIVVILYAIYSTYVVFRSSTTFTETDLLAGDGALDLPQNAWFRASRLWMRQQHAAISSTAILYADIIRREYDGLIVIRPINWYVYYTREQNFYYLTNNSGAKCEKYETPCLTLRAVERSESKKSNFTKCCLDVSFVTLMSIFARRRQQFEGRKVISLEPLLQIDSTEHITITMVINYLIQIRAL